MKIQQLIEAVGENNICLQFLDQCVTAANYSAKSGTKITFGSDVALTPTGTDKLGIVVWLPRDAVSAAISHNVESDRG